MRRMPKLRTAYGPRTQRRYVGDVPTLAARDAEDAGYYCLARIMPRGGVRWLVRCPNCATPCARLYLSPAPPGIYRCRQCLGLRYRSQYAGRRRIDRDLLSQRDEAYQTRLSFAFLVGSMRMLTSFLGSIRRRATAARYRRRYRHGWRAGLPIPMHAGVARQVYPTAWEHELLAMMITVIQIDLARLALYDQPAPLEVAGLYRQIDALATLAA